MTLSDDKVLRFLKKNFVCGWRNIAGQESYAGKSEAHAPDNTAVTTTNGAGHHNIQMLAINRAGEVVHALPGFWDRDVFMEELEFAMKLDKSVAAPGLSAAARSDRFLEAHLDHVLQHRRSVARSSALQPFDVWQEARRQGSDFVRTGGPVTSLKTVDQIVHERMAERPLLPVRDFDIGSFVTMGTTYYDAHCDGCREPQKRKKKTVSTAPAAAPARLQVKKPADGSGLGPGAP